MMRMTACMAALAALAAAACAPLSEREREARDYRKLDFEARYLEFRDRCIARGGAIYVEAGRRIGRRGIPRHTDRYRCI